MPTDIEMTEAMHAVRDALAPDDDVADRVLERAHDAGVPVRRIRRRRRTSWVGSVAAAVAITAIVIAAWPSTQGPEPTSPNVAAAAALKTAGAAAADDSWIPLSAGVYHHVLSMDAPVTVPKSIDPRVAAPTMTAPMYSSAVETWLARDGSGFEIRFSGGAKDVYPRLMRDNQGNVSCCVYDGDMSKVDISPTDVFTYSDSITTQRRPPAGEAPVYRTWSRTPSGYVAGFRNNGGAVPVKGRSQAESFQLDEWGATIDQVDTVNAKHGDDLREAIEKLLDNDEYSRSVATEYSFIRGGRFAETEASWRDKSRILRASKLLASAPFGPEARRELFDVLASQPLAHLDGVKVDHLGRRGMQVSFESVQTRDVPATNITLDQLKRESVALRQVPADIDLTDMTKTSWDIAAHTERHKFFVSIIFDTKTGELLQRTEWLDYHNGVALPTLHQSIKGKGEIQVTESWDVAGSGATVFQRRDQTRGIVSSAPACDVQPAICKPE